MDKSLKTGLTYGLTSGVITTLGLMVGLHSGTRSKLAVLGGIITIAVADAFSDALGIHISEESENTHTKREIWISTGATFLSKFLFALSFVIPVVFFRLSTAILISIIWGMSVLTILSYKIARSQGAKPWNVIAEHLLIAFIVISITHFIGDLIAILFK
ncbi:MAG: VIT1/CCC1 transporter family protein [bacterium]